MAEKSTLLLLLIGTAVISIAVIKYHESIGKRPEDFSYVINRFMGKGACSCDDIESMVSWAEGKKSCVYKDTLGHPTVGIGFNLDRNGARSIINNLGLNYDLVRSGQQCLSDYQISQLFNTDLSEAISGAASCVPSFYSQPECIKNVLIDMTFNMGQKSLCGWPNFVSQLGSKQYAAASRNMKGSKWCGQVGRRCTRNADLVANC